MVVPVAILLLAAIVGFPSAGARLLVRLVNGPSSCAGRVEVLQEGLWGTVCDDDWDLPDAEVVCRQLGCGRAIQAYGSSVYGQGNMDQPVWLQNVKCQGTERSLEVCQFNENGDPDCLHEEDAGVECDGHLLRLTNGTTSCSGRLEVSHDGQWGTVCDDSWDVSDAKVVCRELGCAGVKTANACGRFGEGTGRIWLDEVHCKGEESRLAQCSASKYGVHDCSHREDVGIVCQDPFKLSLSGGPHACAGRLEVFHDGQWGTVCNDFWQHSNSKVVCNELRCGDVQPPEKRRHQSATATGPIWLDDVRCSGRERSLENCRHRIWGYHDCTHREDVHISCSGSSPESRG